MWYYVEVSILRAYWLAEQGLALKRVLFVIVTFVFIFFLEYVKYCYGEKGGMFMRKIKNAFDVPFVVLNSVINLTNSVAGGALLTNAF